MKKQIFIYALTALLACACGGSRQNTNGIAGTWNEYRTDPNDDYGLSSWRFDKDGSGVFTVEGFSNTQQLRFRWEQTDGTTIRITTGDESIDLELSNGLLIEKSGFGSKVYRKQ